MSNNSMLYSLKVGAFVAKIVPRKIGINVSASLGYLYGRYPGKTQKRLLKIHRRISPELSKSELKKRAAQVMASYASYWWDVFWLSSPRQKSDIGKLIEIEGQIYLDEVVKSSKQTGEGIILALPHMGSWELGGAWLAALDYNPFVVVERLKPPELFELFTSTRTKLGMNIIAHDDHPTSKLMAALNEGSLICLVADRDISKRGVVVDFFGAARRMPTGPASLALKTGATILPICMYSTFAGELDVVFYPPIKIPKITNKDQRTEVIQNTTQELSAVFENMISRDPTQWHVLYDEWEQP